MKRKVEIGARDFSCVPVALVTSAFGRKSVSTCCRHRSFQPHARKRPLVPRVSRDSKGPRIKIIARLVSEKMSRKRVKLERINAASELNKVILYTSVKDFCCLCWTSAGIEHYIGCSPQNHPCSSSCYFSCSGSESLIN